MLRYVWQKLILEKEKKDAFAETPAGVGSNTEIRD